MNEYARISKKHTSAYKYVRLFPNKQIYLLHVFHRSYVSIPPLRCQELLPYDERKALLARDPLACAEGFQTLVLLTLRHLFGVRYCRKCPDCAQSDRPCMDAFGSNAMAMGGVFGRVDAVYGSLECQKSGSLHIHLQVFVQCYHQFHSLAELQRIGREPFLEMLQRYTSYAGHVQRMSYCDQKVWEEERDEVERDWPEFRGCNHMSNRPGYQLDGSMNPETWLAKYLAEDVEALQKRKQNHVHLPSGPNGERMPLRHCQDTKNPAKCKSGFPRTKWLTDKPFVICPGLAERRDMPHHGKKSMVGLPWGPYTDPNLNGTHPALTAGLRCNSDVQPPYRFPITPATHDTSLCSDECQQALPIQALIREAQITQAAQVGYTTDYQNKRLSVATNECKEWAKAQKNLVEELADKKPGYVGARLAKRLITDCHARGVCRGAVECTNLLLHAEHQDPTRAETVKTAQVAEMALGYGLHLLAKTAGREPWPLEPRRQQTDARSTRKKLTDCPFWTLYGGRGRAAQAWA